MSLSILIFEIGIIILPFLQAQTGKLKAFLEPGKDWVQSLCSLLFEWI